MRKMSFWLLLTLCLCLGSSAVADTTPPKLSYNAMELNMPAAALRIYVPADMETLEGDEEAFDLGFRFNCFSDTFDLTVWVHDNREMSLKDYAAFYAERNGQKASPETVNGFPVQFLSSEDKPDACTILIADPDANIPDAVYVLSFTGDGEADVKLAEEIINTLARNDSEP